MYSLKNEKYKIPLIIFLIIFLIICISTSIYYGNKLLLGDLEKYDNDDVKYLRSAEVLIEKGELVYKFTDQKTVFIMPGFVFVLVPFVFLFGKIGGIVAFRIFSALLQMFTMYVLFLLFRKVFNSSKLGLLTVILNIFYTANIYVTTLLLSETIFICLLINLIYISIHAVEEKSIKYYIIGGILWGVSILFKPIMLVFPANIFVLMLFNKYTIKEMLRYAWIPLIIMIAIMSPWCIRNFVVFKKFIPLTISSGNPKLQGAFIDYNQDVEYMNELDFSNVGEFGTEMETDQVESKKADIVIKYNFKNNPVEYLYWMIFGKTAKNFNSQFIWYPLYGIKYVVYIVIHEIFLILGLLGIIISTFKKEFKGRYAKYMLMIIILFFNVVHLPYYCFSRYVYPIMPILIGFSGITILSTIERIKTIYRRKIV